MFTFDRTDVTFDSVFHHFGDGTEVDPAQDAPYQPRPADGALRDLVAEAPRGWVWPHVMAGNERSLFEALFQPLAEGIADLEAIAAAMLEEIDPRTASLMLPDFERVLGPDPCGRDPSAMSLEQRRQLAHQRWTQRGGASVQFFLALAAKRGVTIRIVENRVSVTDTAQCGDELIQSPEQFAWTVELTLMGETVARVDDAECGDLLYDIILSDVECDIRRAKPAHTDVAFRYL